MTVGFGMGNYYRHQHELCVFAVKGPMPLTRKNASSVFEANVTRHSEKPQAFYTLVECCSEGPLPGCLCTSSPSRLGRIETERVEAIVADFLGHPSEICYRVPSGRMIPHTWVVGVEGGP